MTKIINQLTEIYVSLYLHWHHIYLFVNCVCIGDTDTILLLTSKFGNKHDRIETLTQFAEWFQFAIHYFLIMWPEVTKLQHFETK